MNDHQCSGRCRREGCPHCPHGRGDEEHCDVCDAVTKEQDSAKSMGSYAYYGAASSAGGNPQANPMNESRPRNKYEGSEEYETGYEAGVKAWIGQAEISSMLKAQKRGFQDVAEVYGTFWLEKEEAQSCEPRARFIPVTITYSLPPKKTQ